MREKTCCFIGHRKIDKTPALVEKTTKVIQNLIEEGVEIFLFGSRSQFDDLCHLIVSKLQEEYPNIKRIMYNCRSEYVVKKEEKEDLEEIWSKTLHQEVRLNDYEGGEMSDRLLRAGRASYVERNQDMINVSDYCVFYYSPNYKPPKRKVYKDSGIEEQPNSGTHVAYEYAMQRKRGGKEITVINVMEE